MKRRPMSYGTAALFALGISLTLHLLFGIISFYGRDALLPPDMPKEMAEKTMLHGMRLLTSFMSTFTITFVIYLLNFGILKSRHREWVKLSLIIVLTLAATVLLSWASTKLQTAVFMPHHNPVKMIKGGIMRDIFVSVIVIFSSQLLYANQRRQQTDLEYESLKAENVLTKYQVLKNQVDPHFLFNSLNTLNSMIKLDPEKAQEYVQQLSSVFRYTLQSAEVNTLEDELRFTGSYCSLMQIRYGDSLRFDVQVDPKYLQYHTIPLSIQAMVENAIKHNVVSNRHPLTVTIRTKDEGPAVVVSNPVQPKKEAEAGAGIGLANIAERARLMWQEEVTVDESGGMFSVTIPLIKP